MTCSECEQECRPCVVDDGIGPYDFGGAYGCDTRPRIASDCCEADVLDDYGRAVGMDDGLTLSDLEYDR